MQAIKYSRTVQISRRRFFITVKGNSHDRCYHCGAIGRSSRDSHILESSLQTYPVNTDAEVGIWDVDMHKSAEE